MDLACTIWTQRGRSNIATCAMMPVHSLHNTCHAAWPSPQQPKECGPAELQEQNFRDREETLKRKDIDLQDSLIRFSKFLQDNDAKRVRALKKAADERKTREEKEREIGETVSAAHSLPLPTLLCRTCQQHTYALSVPHLLPSGMSRSGRSNLLEGVNQRLPTCTGTPCIGWLSLASSMNQSLQPEQHAFDAAKGADRG